MTHVHIHPHHGRGPAAALASAWNALCCLPATHPWFWLVRSAPPGGFAAKIIETCASAHGAAQPSVWFCSMPCQSSWTRLARERFAMVDLTEEERAAITATMKRVALLMDEIGWATPLAELTEAQVRALIEEAVEGFREAMSDIARAQTPEVPF